ncbi:conserved hypothetical protein [Candidatus Desulfarcum epimagneticum]|uniref:Peptidase M54 n=1 Tax=uncultured Desulfobacteraceae bacterium TaxID=218296 RepID=A0A484HIU7_9BACT|nr:conserved hypothetical protein [uncultured Desulfobacteraceae bacterium]
MIAPAERTIAISPIGDHFESLYEPVSREIRRVMGFQPEILPILGDSDIDFALDEERGQRHSTPILEKIAGRTPPHVLKILAVTREDLFIPILTHVYGEAQLGGRAAVVSTFRLAEGLSPVDGEEILQTRTAKEAVHELGHTFNLRHCRERACVMHYCRSIGDVDKKSGDLCRYCRTLLDDEKKRLSRGAL